MEKSITAAELADLLAASLCAFFFAMPFFIITACRTMLLACIRYR